MPPALLGPPALELGDGAAAACPEEQDGAAVGRGHPAELGAEALVIRVRLGNALPREAVDLLGGARSRALLRLELQIELHGLLEALAAGAVAAAGPGAAEALVEGDGGDEEGGEAEGVGDDGEIEAEVDGGGGGGGGVGEEDGEGVEDVGEVGGDEEGAGEEDQDEDEEVEGGRGGVGAEGGGGGGVVLVVVVVAAAADAAAAAGARRFVVVVVGLGGVECRHGSGCLWRRRRSGGEEEEMVHVKGDTERQYFAFVFFFKLIFFDGKTIQMVSEF